MENVQVKVSDQVTRVVLNGDITIALAPELKEGLLTALSSAPAIAVSLAGATSLDIAAIQLLWAASRQAQAATLAFAWERPLPAQILASLEQAGIPLDFLGEGRP